MLARMLQDRMFISQLRLHPEFSAMFGSSSELHALLVVFIAVPFALFIVIPDVQRSPSGSAASNVAYAQEPDIMDQFKKLGDGTHNFRTHCLYLRTRSCQAQV